MNRSPAWQRQPARRRVDRARVWAPLVTLVLAALPPAPGLAAPEVDRDAYWIESAVCAVSIRTVGSASLAEPGQALGSLSTATAYCSGNQMAQTVTGGVNSLLLRGFRITAAHHQVTPLPPRADGEVSMLVTGLFALERPALKAPPPFPR